MDRSNVIALVSVTYAQDSKGQYIETETQKNVFCNVKNVSQTEFFKAGNNGFNPEYQVTMFKYDYNNEQKAVINGKRFAIYRTYERTDDLIELYFQNESGVTHV